MLRFLSFLASVRADNTTSARKGKAPYRTSRRLLFCGINPGSEATLTEGEGSDNVRSSAFSAFGDLLIFHPRGAIPRAGRHRKFLQFLRFSWRLRRLLGRYAAHDHL